MAKKKMSVVSEYFLKVAEVDEEIAELKRLVGKHGDGEEIRWPHHGDMCHVVGRLKEINSFLRNEG